MLGTSTIRGLSMLCAVLSIGLFPVRSEASDNPWPLVNAADVAVWGTLVHTSKGLGAKLIVIRPDDALSGSGPIAPVRLVDHVVGLPEGTHAFHHARGLYLATTSDPRETGFAAVDGTILVGGFVSGWPEPSVRERITRLVTPAEGSAFTEEDALILLASEWAPARALALGWWRERGAMPSPVAKIALDTRLTAENTQERILAFELYLLRDWAVPSTGLVDRFIAADEPVLADLTLRAIAKDGGNAARADLLLAWGPADSAGRTRLLIAYATLQIEESLPWWREALASDEPELTTVAIQELGRSGIPGAHRAYRALLEADDQRVVSLALEGLARTATPESGAILEQFLSARPKDDPLAAKAVRLLRHPRRYGARPPRSSPLEDGGR